MPKPGKETRKEHWTKLVRNMMEEPAWRALSPTAQALYPWLRLEWHGPDNNNNGKIRLSVRQAAERMGIGLDTAMRAYHDLQAKGFIVMTEMAHLGCSGAAKSPAYELTELPTPDGSKRDGRKLFKEWKRGHDFPVRKARANNPNGANGKTKSHHQNHDGAVINIMTFTEKASSK